MGSVSTARDVPQVDRRRALADGAADTEAAKRRLHPKVLAELRDLVLASGGVDKREAAILHVIVDWLEAIQTARGFVAAQGAARRVKAVWLS